MITVTTQDIAVGMFKKIRVILARNILNYITAQIMLDSFIHTPFAIYISATISSHGERQPILSAPTPHHRFSWIFVRETLV